MTLVREPGSDILAQFDVPTRGTWINRPIHTIPLDAVYDSLNVYVKEGKLRNRPGLETILTAFPYNVLHSRYILGAAMGVTPTEKLLFASAGSRLYIYSDVTDTWTSVEDATAAGTPNAGTIIDIAFLETSSTYVTLFASEGYALKHWKPGDTTMTYVTGTNIPLAKSICISSSRVIALIPPHTIVWSRVLNYTNFDALAIVKRAQTADYGICVRSISALSFILYKEYSIHTARAQAGLDEGTAFAFSEPIIVEGPAGALAVVEVEGRHIYMTKSGRIAIFDGTNYPTWIADGMWVYLQNSINQSVADRIRGVYDYRLNIVVFFYPRVGTDVTGCTGMVIVNLPFVGAEAEAGVTPYCFLGVCSKVVMHACTKRFDSEINRAIIFTEPELLDPENETIVLTHQLNETALNDSGLGYNCAFQTGLQAIPDARHMQVSTESFIERSASYGSVTIQPVISDILENVAGTIPASSGQTIDLTTAPVNEYFGFNENLRFFGVKYTWPSTAKVRYSGTVVYSSLANRLKR